MFEDVFTLTAPAPDPRSALEALRLPGARPRRPGVYRDGLIVLLDAAFDASCFDVWPAMKGRFAPFAYTALGDFFLWDYQKKVVQMLDVQRGVLDDVADDADALLDKVLTPPHIVDEVLLRPHVERIVALRGALQYGKAFILEPWLMLGGEPRPDRYVPGDVRVYVNLVGQTHFADEDEAPDA